MTGSPLSVVRRAGVVFLAIAFAVFCVLAAGACFGQEPYGSPRREVSEAEWRDRIADAWRANGVEVTEEATTPAGTRCDLLTGTTAYEIDFADKVYECCGQTVLYANIWQRKRGMVILVTPGSDQWVNRARIIAAEVKAELILVPADGAIPLPAGFKKAPQVRKAGQKVENYFFTAEWCGNCQKVKPHVLALKAEGVDVTVLDTDLNQEFCRGLGVESIPCVLRVVDGKEQARYVGTLSKDAARDFFASGATP
jgi:thiol-disulfide isomerase/thioredoxin